ncbi:hypothetical protein L596_012274 [Steinernema carpocapsae]|nr:hypothetical protein L596_012274 [Steinernema carpocapsae]
MVLVDFSVGNNLASLDIVMSRPDPVPTSSMEEFRTAFNLVHFNVCASVPEEFQEQRIRYDWTMKLEGSTLYDEQLPATFDCSILWKAPTQASYIVTVTGYASNGTEKALMGQKRITVVDKWIAVVGDSYASGEGNPNTKCEHHRPAMWISGCSPSFDLFIIDFRRMPSQQPLVPLQGLQEVPCPVSRLCNPLYLPSLHRSFRRLRYFDRNRTISAGCGWKHLPVQGFWPGYTAHDPRRQRRGLLRNPVPPYQ